MFKSAKQRGAFFAVMKKKGLVNPAARSMPKKPEPPKIEEIGQDAPPPPGEQVLETVKAKVPKFTKLKKIMKVKM